MKVNIPFGFPGKRRSMRNFRARRCFLLSALRSALQFSPLVAFIFFTPVLGVYFNGALPDGLKLARALGLFVAGEMCFPLRRIVVMHGGNGISRHRWIALPALLIAVLINELRTRIAAWFMRFAIRAVRGERALEFGCEHANSARAGAAIGALIAGIALGVLLGSRSATTLTADYATSQAMVFALRIAMIAGGGGGLLTVYLRRFLCDTSVSVDLAWRRTLVRARLAMRIARRARARRKAPIKAIEGDIK